MLQITEMKAKLETVHKIVKDLERERYQTQEECKRLGDLMRSRLAQEMVGEQGVCQCFY